MIIPVEEVAYAAWRRPTQNAQPAGHPEAGSKSVNTNLAERRPSFAMAKTEMTMAITPAKVQKMANVYNHQHREMRGMWIIRTSKYGKYLFPNAETRLQMSVIATNVRKIW